MSRFKHFRARLRIAVAVALTSSAACPLAASPAADGTVPGGSALGGAYSYQAAGRSPVDVLERFAADHGLRLRIDARASTGASQRWRRAAIDGWLRGESGREFLERLATAYGFEWFVTDRVLHVTDRSDATTERIALGGADARSAQAALAAVGLHDPRFGWGVLPGQDAVLVSGPREYVAAVRRFLAPRVQARTGGPQLEAMVFALRYAHAADGAPAGQQRDARPGVASVLRQLIGTQPHADVPRFQLPSHLPAQTAVDASASPAAGAAFAGWLGGAQAAYELPPLPESRAAATWLADAPRRSDPVVVADEETNSVLVWAESGLRPRIQQIVDALDQPSPMVSIEVVVFESDDPSLHAVTTDAAGAGRSAPPGAPAPYLAWSRAAGEQRARLLNRQRVVGFSNRHLMLEIGAEAPSISADAKPAESNGRTAQRGDSLDVVARLLPGQAKDQAAIAVDIALVATQPTGLPGQEWTNTSRLSLQTGVALQDGDTPQLVASYPVATGRARQRAIFIHATRI